MRTDQGLSTHQSVRPPDGPLRPGPRAGLSSGSPSQAATAPPQRRGPGLTLVWDSDMEAPGNGLGPGGARSAGPNAGRLGPTGTTGVGSAPSRASFKSKSRGSRVPSPSRRVRVSGCGPWTTGISQISVPESARTVTPAKPASVRVRAILA